jgi:hypothetical protein
LTTIYDGEYYNIVYDDVVTEVEWGNSENYGLVGSKITEVILPESVTKIGYNCFDGCKLLENITYNGTIEQWNSIDKRQGWSGGNWSDPILATVVHCTDGDVTIE